MKTIPWIQNAVIYQIYPDSFARAKDPEQAGLFEPWDSPETPYGFKGGNLKGAEEKLPYLKELGIDAVYFNPIFASCSNHRYHTHDYFNVDPVLGGNAAFDDFLQKAHELGIKVILDGVFNHAGRGFFQFNHVLECGESSPYRDWFIIHDYPVRAYNFHEGEGPNYHCWWGLPALPKLNYKNREVRSFILKVAEYWLKKGIDGWRLDVPEEINGQDFWRDFRKVCKAVNPDCYITGEIWGDGSKWLKGDMFDAVMNYRLSLPCICYFAGDKIGVTHKYAGKELKAWNRKKFIEEIEKLLSSYSWETTLNQMNMMSSHDTDRMPTAYGGDIARMKQAIVFSMLFPGAVNIYYGEEIGLDGALNNGTRRTMPWSRKSLWKKGIYDFYRRIIEIRKTCPAVKDGKFSFLKEYSEPILAFERKNGSSRTVCIMNCSDSVQTAESVHGRIILSEGVTEAAGKISLAPRGFIIFLQ